MNIPMSSPLTRFDTRSGKLWDENYVFDGEAHEIPGNTTPSQIVHTAKLWLNLLPVLGGSPLTPPLRPVEGFERSEQGAAAILDVPQSHSKSRFEKSSTKVCSP